jgi:molybdopterin/thiamine biosynthesis adenylyltransferase
MEIKSIAVYGLGAIGSNLLVQLAKQHPEIEFHGIDFDKIEDRNIRTQAYFLEHVGLPKVDAMRVVLSRYLRKPKYKPFNLKIDRPEKVGRQDLILDCFDNSDSRDLFKHVKGDVLHIGFSPLYSAECIWNERYDVPNDVDPTKNDICSMSDAVPFIHYVVNLAALNISSWIAGGPKRDFLVTGKHRVRWL